MTNTMMACLLILVAVAGHGADGWLRGAAAESPRLPDGPAPGDDSVSIASVSSARLAGTGSPLKGRLEVNFGGQWGVVCSHGFTAKAARVACRQLKLGGGTVSAKFAQGRLPYTVGSFQCHGNEQSLAGCRYSITNQCPGGKAVGLVCKNPPIKQANLDSNIYSPSPYAGRLTVMLGPTTNYGSVCDATGTFSDREAVVACRTMGYIGGRVLPKSDFLGCCPGFVAISNLRCKGSEVSLSGCSYNISPNCTHDQDVGVACDVPPHVQVRLANGKAFNNGRLEVRIGGKWGTVCGTGFNQAAAQVVCRNLNLTGGTPRYGAVYGKGKSTAAATGLGGTAFGPKLAAVPGGQRGGGGGTLRRPRATELRP
ncbi:hypothetical protein CHLNCDRAFT_144237 [Chlorella variabilis]|uniref:SRCR domain-containing protein n=1 Tax=Chlorella variabilis TaxID=554065 RepID=E1ZC84_CHLVA|nr:hypothetical protein CHLNCDRAFT_144237 [Chlorella variabilis]EFN56566.1 hypothetical protein CHLNCDRAFT_144237 [Chlorella variabilis]|eukprot:XP_005848668.1 hypothetical protein CHLNCDRAFT_144237 [Chlorella variabilis]